MIADTYEAHGESPNDKQDQPHADEHKNLNECLALSAPGNAPDIQHMYASGSSQMSSCRPSGLLVTGACKKMRCAALSWCLPQGSGWDASLAARAWSPCACFLESRCLSSSVFQGLQPLAQYLVDSYARFKPQLSRVTQKNPQAEGCHIAAS